jgi:hypothetical protein
VLKAWWLSGDRIRPQHGDRNQSFWRDKRESGPRSGIPNRYGYPIGHLSEPWHLFDRSENGLPLVLGRDRTGDLHDAIGYRCCTEWSGETYCGTGRKHLLNP